MRHKNKGFTLVELLVSMTILALIILAVSGIMANNNIIFRKTKSDITVQNNAQDVYTRMTQDIQQAKHVYIEGYEVAYDKAYTFKASTFGDTVTQDPGSVKKYLKQTDKYICDNRDSHSTKDFINVDIRRDGNTSRDQLIIDKGISATDIARYDNILTLSGADLNTALTDLENEDPNKLAIFRQYKYYTPSDLETYRKSLDSDALKAFDVCSERFRYMDSSEVSESASFLDVTGPVAKNDAKDFSTLLVDRNSNKYSYVYVTKLVLEYPMKVNSNFVPSGVTVPTGAKDEVTVTYTFVKDPTPGKNKMDINATYSYKYMTDLNTAAGSELICDQLNYLNYSSGSSSVDIPGCEVQVDYSNDSIKLNLYFADNSMSYKDLGMIKLRNSYILHDAN